MANSMPEIEFVRLSDLPDLVGECAHFHARMSDTNGEGASNADGALDMREAAFRRLALDGEEEDAVIGIVSDGFRGGQIAALAVLVKAEMEAFEDLGPWLAGVFVDPVYDQGGLKEDLCAEVEDLADELGYAQIFVHTDDIEPFKALGYAEIEPFTRNDKEHWVLGKAL